MNWKVIFALLSLGTLAFKIMIFSNRGGAPKQLPSAALSIPLPLVPPVDTPAPFKLLFTEEKMKEWNCRAAACKDDRSVSDAPKFIRMSSMLVSDCSLIQQAFLLDALQEYGSTIGSKDTQNATSHDKTFNEIAQEMMSLFKEAGYSVDELAKACKAFSAPAGLNFAYNSLSARPNNINSNSSHWGFDRHL